MTPSDAVRIIQRLADAYGGLVSEGLAKTLAQFILAFPQEAADRAVSRWIESESYPPKASDLVSRVRDEMPAVASAADAAFWKRMFELVEDPTAQLPDEDPRIVAAAASERERRANLPPNAAAKLLSSPEQIAVNIARLAALFQQIARRALP